MLIGTRTVIRTRRTSSGIGADYQAAPATETQSNIVASVQPVTGRELERLEAGRRSAVTLKIYTEADVRTADARAGTLADRIVIDGQTYEVEQTETYGAEGGLGHTKALLAEVQE